MNTLAIAASALIAQQTNVAVIAGNVANATTPDYKARTAQLVPMDSSNGYGGVKVGAIITDVAPPPFSGGASNQEVDLVAEFANLMQARTAYSAALKVVASSDQMTHALLASV